MKNKSMVFHHGSFMVIPHIEAENGSEKTAISKYHFIEDTASISHYGRQQTGSLGTFGCVHLNVDKE